MKTTWEFRAGFKHRFTGNPPRTLCSQASPDLLEKLVDESDVPVPDTPTCWLCLAIMDWMSSSQRLNLEETCRHESDGVDQQGGFKCTIRPELGNRSTRLQLGHASTTRS